MKIIYLLFLMLPGLISYGCPSETSACSKLTDKASCESHYMKNSCKENTTKTYCTQCSVCIAGRNNCIKGALGCNSCKIGNGKYTCEGTACKWFPERGKQGECSNGGGNISCGK